MVLELHDRRNYGARNSWTREETPSLIYKRYIEYIGDIYAKYYFNISPTKIQDSSLLTIAPWGN